MYTALINKHGVCINAMFSLSGATFAVQPDETVVPITQAQFYMNPLGKKWNGVNFE